jgi:hypothetical protein
MNKASNIQSISLIGQMQSAAQHRGATLYKVHASFKAT